MELREDNSSSYFASAVFITILSNILAVTLYLPKYLIAFSVKTVAISICSILLISYFSIKMLLIADRIGQKKLDSRYHRSGNLCALSSIIIIFYLQIPIFIIDLEIREIINLFLLSIINILAIFLILKSFKNRTYIPILVSILLFISNTLFIHFSHDLTLYFLINFIILIICMIYREYLQFVVFIIIMHYGIAFIYFSHIFTIDDRDLFIIKWGFLAYISILVMVIVKFSSEKKSRIELADASLSALMSTTPNLIVIVDELNLISNISKPLADLAHIEEREMGIGRPVIDLFPEMEMKLLISDIISSTTFYDSTIQLTLNGVSRYFKIISDKFQTNIAGRFIDISDISEIMEAKFEAEKSNKAKSMFLAKMSHEIRTPMNSIIGMTDLILRRELHPDVRENTQIVQQSGLHLLSIINDILDISKIESGKFEAINETYEFNHFIKDIIDITKVKVFEKNLIFNVFINREIPSKLYGDAFHIKQIIINVLNNAIKYTQEGFVKIHVDYKFTDVNVIQLIVTISDSGIGISKDNVKHIFDEFSQIDNANKKGIESTGLGLSIVKNLTKVLGGEISVETTYGEGSTFKISIPLKTIDNNPIATVDNPTLKPVLIFEDNQIIIESIVISMNNLDVPVTIATNIVKFNECIESNKFKFAFISNHLSDKINFNSIKRIKDTKIIVMSDDNTINSDADISVSMPLLPDTITNILNNKKIDESFNKPASATNSFTAPDATVLIVDDIETNLKVAEGLMQPYLFKVIVCQSGAEALRQVEKVKFDLILMDHMMPGMDGIETTTRIRNHKNEQIKNIPVVALTANTVSGMQEEFINSGFNDFLSKPIDLFKLDEVLKKWLITN
jgi:signal transduction histidine kinase/DNA-binding response OmpR family regulator